MEDRDSLVEIDAEGAARPAGPTALLRMQARQGGFWMLPAPPHLIVMRQAQAGARSCRLSGEIRSPGALCDVVGFIGHGGWNGELVVLEQSASRSIYFDQGDIVGAQSTVLAERLGEVLYRYGVVDREQVSACSDATATGALRFGEAAVKMGFVTREKLFGLTAKQIEEIFYGVLLVGSGMFYFLDSYDGSVLSSRQKLSVAMLVREGIRRMHETRYFRARIPSDQHVPVVTPGRASPETDPAQIYGSIDGTRSVAEICRLLGQSEFEVCRSLFQLIQSGHVTVNPPRLGPAAIVDVYNQAIALILRELDATDEGDAVRDQLASFAEGSEVCRALLDGSGPADDGTLKASRVVENLGRLQRPQPEEVLGKALFDLASYALFLARPQLRRAQEARDRATPAPGKKRLSQRVAAMLEPIAPAADRAPSKK